MSGNQLMSFTSSSRPVLNRRVRKITQIMRLTRLNWFSPFLWQKSMFKWAWWSNAIRFTNSKRGFMRQYSLSSDGINCMCTSAVRHCSNPPNSNLLKKRACVTAPFFLRIFYLYSKIIYYLCKKIFYGNLNSFYKSFRKF